MGLALCSVILTFKTYQTNSTETWRIIKHHFQIIVIHLKVKQISLTHRETQIFFQIALGLETRTPVSEGIFSFKSLEGLSLVTYQIGQG